MVTAGNKGSNKANLRQGKNNLKQKNAKIWLNRIKRRDNTPQYKSCYVRSMHFTSHCFETSAMESLE